MHLKTIKYGQYIGEMKEWTLSSSAFQKIALIVGKNASGKTRTLNVLAGLSKLINGEKPYSNGIYEVDFTNGDNNYNYCLNMENGIITHELLKLNNAMMLTRDDSGKGEIYTNQTRGNLNFSIPKNMLATVVKRDPEQHDFLEPLHEWANSVLHYRFADDLEKRTFIAFQKNQKSQEHKFNSIVLLKKGIDKFGDKFKSSIILDLKLIGYKVTDIGLKFPDNVESYEGPPINCLYLQEEDLPCLTEQTDMSDGMFRALSLLIKLNYMILGKSNPHLYIDDIGEGLDFNRCKSLIETVINKAINEDIGLTMSTNDQFVMNGVDLDYWGIADRNGNNVSIINKENSPEVFEKFKFIGLSNFEFIASDFFKS